MSKLYSADVVPSADGTFLATFRIPGAPQRTLKGSYDSHVGAQCAAFRAMQDELNRRRRPAKTRPSISTKMDNTEFGAALNRTGLRPAELAMLWGTFSERILSWVDGDDEPPFPMWWVLELLADDDLRDLAVTIASSHTVMKADWLEFDAARMKAIALMREIEKRIVAVVDPSSPDGSRQEQYRAAAAMFEELRRLRMPLDVRIDRMVAIADMLGMAEIDVNAWIEEQNQPFRGEVEDQRREQRRVERYVRRQDKVESNEHTAARAAARRAQRRS